MEIQGPPKPNTLYARLSGVEIKAANLLSNQQITAVVIKRLDNGQYLLKIANQLVSTQLGIEIAPGKKILVEILKLSEPIKLETTVKPKQISDISKILRTLLPIQLSATKLFLVTNEVLKNSNYSNLLPKEILNLLNKLQTRSIDYKTITHANTLKQAVKNSGVFFEAKLVNNITTQDSNAINSIIKNDFKALLLQLNTALTSSVQVKQNVAQTISNNQSVNKQNDKELTYSLNMTTLKPKETSQTKTSLQQYTGAVVNTSSKQSDSQQTLNNLSKQIQTSFNLKAISQEPVSPALFNELLKLKTDKNDLQELNPLLRSLFPLMQNSHNNQTIELKNLKSTDSLLRYLLKQVDGSLARIQVTQINSSPQETETKTPWLFEIPIKKQDETNLFQFKIEYEKVQTTEEEPEKDQSENHDEKQWTVKLTFDLKGLGPVSITLKLNDKNINTHFWIKEKPTLTLFENNLHELQQRLEALGFNVNQLFCHAGVSSPENSTDNTDTHNYLDEQA